MTRQHSHDQTPPQGASPIQDTRAEQGQETSTPDSNLHELSTPPRVLDLSDFTDAQVGALLRNLTGISETIQSFQKELEVACRQPLDNFLKSVTDEILSSKRCMEIFECRRALREAVSELDRNLLPPGRRDHSPLFSLYIAEVEKHTAPLYEYDTGTLRMVELSDEPGWRPYIEAALASISEAAYVTEDFLEWLAKRTEEIREDLTKRVSPP